MTQPPNSPFGQPNQEPRPPEYWLAQHQAPSPESDQPYQPHPEPETEWRFAGVPPVGFAQADSPLPSNYMPNIVAALLACFGIIVGSLGPWVTFLNFSKSGVDGDGALTLVLGAAAAIALFTILSRGGKAKFGDRWVAPAVGAITVVIGIIDAMNVSDAEATILRTTVSPSIGWGLWVVLLCGAALCVTSSTVAQIVGKRSR